MPNTFEYSMGSPIWLICNWEKGPICYGLILDMIGAIFLIASSIVLPGIVFLGWFGVFPKAIRRRLRD